MPLGLNAPVNSRFELALNFITARQLATGYTFEVWIKYGKSTNLTLVGNQTSQSIANGAQTMVSVKIPTIAGATVAGISIQGARASDNMTAIIPKIPKRKPAMSITRKISNGCELTLFEKIIGWDKLLSIT